MKTGTRRGIPLLLLSWFGSAVGGAEGWELETKELIEAFRMYKTIPPVQKIQMSARDRFFFDKQLAKTPPAIEAGGCHQNTNGISRHRIAHMPYHTHTTTDHVICLLSKTSVPHRI